MHGNAQQWCADCYDEDYYRKSPADNPKCEDQGNVRVVRGGSWLAGHFTARSAARGNLTPDSSSDDTGFRVARTQ